MRLASIDILRALTMLFMIWVNDFWSLTEVPKWLEHAKKGDDYLGFSDVIFPLFLFIVGLSIPFAIQNRQRKGEGKATIAKHILIRFLSLLLIGVFMVNYETAHHESIIIGKYYWCILMALAVVLIWMDWKRSPIEKKWYAYLQVLGIFILIFLAFIYRGGEIGEDGMKTQWWGILGLIGWAYAINALVYLFANGNFIAIVLLWLGFNLLSVLGKTEMALDLSGFSGYFSTILSGSIPAFTAGGIVAAKVFKKLSGSNIKWTYIGLILLGLINIGYGLATRPYWGIAKLGGTPSWVAVCTGIGFLMFILLFYFADVKKKTSWAKVISPAGTAALTCYMIPYFLYPIWNITGLRLPAALNTSILGLLISFGFALMVVVLTGWFERKGYKLKL